MFKSQEAVLEDSNLEGGAIAFFRNVGIRLLTDASSNSRRRESKYNIGKEYEDKSRRIFSSW